MCTFKPELTELKTESVLLKHITSDIICVICGAFYTVEGVGGRVCDTRTFTIAEIWLAVCHLAFSHCKRMFWTDCVA